MHDPERTGDALILQVKVEGLELRRGEHALEDEGSAGKAWEINGFAARSVLAGTLGSQLVLSAFAHHIRSPLQFDAGGAADERLTEGGHGVTGQCA